MESEQAALFAALARARGAVKPVSHDAENTYHRYKYTSAEAVIGACTRALATEGLSLVPIAFTHEAQGSGQWSVQTQWVLTHAEGGTLHMARTMVAEEGKGRPADKAILVANTSLLAYQLRDLLGLQRPDAGEEVAARDDTTYEPRKPVTQKEAKPQTRQAPRSRRPPAERPATSHPANDLVPRARSAIESAETPGRLAAVRDKVLVEFERDETTRAELLAAVQKRHTELTSSNGIPTGRHRAAQTV